MRIGAHVSPAGGPAKAIERGLAIGCQAIQIFNQSPRAWRPREYSQEEIAAYHEAFEASEIDSLLIHAVYLLNCASADEELRGKSLTSLVTALRAGDELKADGVVLHAGSALKGDVGEAIRIAGETIKEALAESDRCELHLENTAGAGGTLGRSFDELAALLDAAGGQKRLRICLDSCHLYASGYDVRTPEALGEVLAGYDRIIGLDRLASLHLNDSQAAFNSNRDRHATLGDGELGRDGLAAFLSEPRFEGLPCILETKADEKQVAIAIVLRDRGLTRRAWSTDMSPELDGQT